MPHILRMRALLPHNLLELLSHDYKKNPITDSFHMRVFWPHVLHELLGHRCRDVLQRPLVYAGLLPATG